jgi:GntR family transcriptional repressor for pyruvate dehydrogenase complex
MINRPGGTLSDHVAAELQSRIVSGRLTPGERLPTEAELCALFGVSRSVVRDAVRTLSSRGLISVRQGHGMEVAEITDDGLSQALIILLMRSDLSVHDVLEAREVIETELAGLAATRATQADLERLERELASFGEAVAKQDWDAAGNSHLQFHLALLDAVNLRALAIMLKPMQEVILFSSIPPPADDVSLWEYDVHPPILEALKAKDETAVRKAMADHFATYDRPAYQEVQGRHFRDGPQSERLLTEMLSAKRSRRSRDGQ